MLVEAERLLGGVFALVMCVVCGLLAVAAFRRTKEIFSPWTVFLAMAVGDIYLPGALFFSVGPPQRAPWIVSSADEMVLPAMALFTIGLALFALGYGVADSGIVFNKGSRSGAKHTNHRASVSRRRAYLTLGVSGFAYAWLLTSNVLAQESFQSYLNVRLTNRFPAEALAGGGSLSTLMSLSVLPVFLVTTAVMFSQRSQHSIFRGLLIPLLGVLAAATTFLRGYILSYVIGLTIIETRRMRDRTPRGPASRSNDQKPHLRRIGWLALAGVLLFSTYGSVRNFLTAKEYGLDLSPAAAARLELQQFIRGEGLMGLAAILEHYPRESEFFNGKTLIDMLLLPVPRSVWPDKPLWYGIDNITREMGWPPSTQSAVTMPGELYANFGYAGVLFMLIYGLVFGYLHRLRHGARFRYIYAFVVVPMMLLVFWMAFTGFMNQLIPALVMGLVLWFMFPKPLRVRRPASTRLAVETQ